MSRYLYDSVSSSPPRPSFSPHGSLQLPRTESLIEVRALLKEHGTDEFQSARKSEDEIKSMKNKAVRRYYKHQNELVGFGLPKVCHTRSRSRAPPVTACQLWLSARLFPGDRVGTYPACLEYLKPIPDVSRVLQRASFGNYWCRSTYTCARRRSSLANHARKHRESSS